MTDQPSAPTPPQPPAPGGQARQAPPAKGRPRLVWLIVGLALLVALVVWLIVRGGGDSGVPKVKNGVPTALSEGQLKDYARAQPIPVYWAGPKPNTTYEMTRTSDGRYYVRYLPKGTPIGTRQLATFTVGSYPLKNAYNQLSGIARQPGQKDILTRSGALVVINRKKPTSVYFAFPRTDFEVEVFDPDPKVARAAVLDGSMQRLR